jgi:hypothetical protein
MIELPGTGTSFISVIASHVVKCLRSQRARRGWVIGATSSGSSRQEQIAKAADPYAVVADGHE